MKKENKKSFFGRLFSSNEEKEVNITKKRGYDAARTTDSNFAWTKMTTNQDYDIYKDLNSLRARSRDLAKNDPIFKHYLSMLDSNIVGKDGFKLKILTDKVDNKKIDLIKAVTDAFYDWSKQENCDITRKNDLKEICSVSVKTMARDGEFLIRLIREKASEDNKYGFKLQMLDPDRIATEINKELPGGNYIKMGIEFSKYGYPIAYHLRKYENNTVFNSNYNMSNYERVDQKDIIHKFKQEDPEQTRGVPWGHAIMIYLKDLSDFHKACLLAGKIGAASSIYLERESNVKTSDLADYEENDEYYSELEAGSISTLPVGAKLKSFDGKYPSETYESYTKRMLQLIAGGLSLSQVFLGNDTEDLNYSTARTVILEERNYYETVQKFIIDNLLMKVFDEFLLQSILNKKIKINSLSFLKVSDIEDLKFSFIGRKWQAIDPQKEANATELEHKNLTKPLSTILSEKGLDLVETLEQYKQDQELIKNILGDNFSIDIVNKQEVQNNNQKEEE